MFDMTKYITRYFQVKLKDETVIDVEPPKLNVLRQIAKISKDIESFNENDITALCTATSLALSKNRQNKKISIEYLEENFDYDLLYNLLVEYFNWVGEIQSSKN